MAQVVAQVVAQVDQVVAQVVAHGINKLVINFLLLFVIHSAILKIRRVAGAYYGEGDY